MDLFAIFSLAAVNGCAGQGSARCKQYRNPKGDIAVIAGLRRLGIVSNSRCLDGKFRSSSTGFRNDSQCVFAHRQSFQIGSFQSDNGAAFLDRVVGSVQVFAVYLYLLEVFISCIGSKGTFPDDSPVIGNNVDIGQNAQILGGIYIADGVKIGAGAVVTKSVLVPGVTVVGVPARIVEK